MLFLKFLYSIQPVSAKFYRIYPDYFHQTGYFSHRPKSTKSARSLKVWRSKRTGRKLRLHFYFVFYFLIYLSLFIAHFQYFTSMYTQFGSVLFLGNRAENGKVAKKSPIFSLYWTKFCCFIARKHKYKLPFVNSYLLRIVISS